ncbi:MAG: hypothetical protein R3E01_20165 [Pirellulaceae bacterium]|nr:hypothetical protein [Planctomycetales bacterium]
MTYRAMLVVVGLSLLPLAAGCEKGCSVSGTVTLNGEPVKKGEVIFHPADGQGQMFAGQIVDGHYEVDEASPGSRRAQINAYRDINFAVSQEEMQQRAADLTARGVNHQGLVNPADVDIPPNAEGNNTTVEITSGTQTLDFNVVTPKPVK